jgi:DNA-binding CsgD family transcriptional regulator
LRQLANPGEFDALRSYATVALELGELDLVLELAAEIEARGRAWRPEVASAWGLLLRGSVAARNGEAILAEELLGQAFDLQKALQVDQLRVALLIEQGHSMLDQGAVDRAETVFREAIQAAFDAGLRILLSRALDGLARCAAFGRPVDAIRLAAAADGMRATLGVVRWPTDLRRSSLWLSATRRELGEHAYDAAWRSGEALTVDEAIDLMRPSHNGPGASADQTGSLLTRRETEVAELVARGASTNEIAAELVISVATVRVHVDHIMAKLDLHSRIQIAQWVTERGAKMTVSTSPTRD